MFIEGQKQNKIQPKSNAKMRLSTYTSQFSRSDRKQKMNILRQMYTSEALNWNISFNKFAEVLNQNNNHYSLILTLFQITADPLWRNRIIHICALIKKLHNICAQRYGDYLTEISKIQNYHSKLFNIFYLNNQDIQEHFRMLITIYLSYNSKFKILNEAEISVGLIDAGKYQKGHLVDYLWIVSQIKIDYKSVGKLIKLADDCLNSNFANKIEIILPILTALANYIVCQKLQDVLDQMMNNSSFQKILMVCLLEKSTQINREALLLCNNILAKSKQLGSKLLSSSSIVLAAFNIACEQKPIFQQLVKIRRGQNNMI